MIQNNGETTPRTTSHWVVDEASCIKMQQKYGWDLVEIKRRISARDPLVVECIFQGDCPFPARYGEQDS
jgi:hypothetical protein